mgnify:CR=1 FL=1
MNHDIKLVAVDIDGTFVRSDYTYDISRFKRILSCMENAGCNFVVAILSAERSVPGLL